MGEMASATQSAPLASPIRFAVQPAEWLCLVVGLFLLNRYAWLMDDAYVYFRYIDNWLFLGYGLVYNKDEFVEGFSSPAWVLILGAFRYFHANYWVIVRLLGCASFATFWYASLHLHRRMTPDSARPGINIPMLYLCANYGVLTYFTSGLESPLVPVFAVVYALFILTPQSRGLAVLIALSPLVRQEFALTAFLCWLWAWSRGRRFPWFLTACGAIFNGTYELFRIDYYASLFPNTFYLKDEFDLNQGLRYVLDTAIPYGWLILVPTAVLLIVLARKNVSNLQTFMPERAFMAIVALAIVAYVVKIGGDPRHFRYLAFPFCLLTCACAGLIECAMGPRLHSGWTRNLLALLVLGGSAMLYPRQLAHHPIWLLQGDTTLDKINDAHRHRTNDGGPGRMPPFSPPWNAWRMPDNLLMYDRYATIMIPADFPGKASSGCAIIYRDPFSRYVHSFGLTDPILAFVTMPSDRPAHKRGLIPMADQLAALHQEYQGTPKPGMYRELISTGKAPRWVAEGLDSIEIIERRMYNQHKFWPNLRLALRHVPKIAPIDAPPPPPAPDAPNHEVEAP